MRLMLRYVPHAFCLALTAAWFRLILPGPLAVAAGVAVVAAAATTWWFISGSLLPWLAGARHIAEVVTDIALCARLEAKTAEDAVRLGIHGVRLLVADHPVANAVAAGNRYNGAVVLTTGLLGALNEGQMRAVIGHELAHLAHGDNLVLAVSEASGYATRLTAWALAALGGVFLMAAVVAGALVGLVIPGVGALVGGAWTLLRRLLGLGVYLSGLVAGALVVAAMREAEYRADATGAQLAGTVAMVGALTAIQRVNGPQSPLTWWGRLWATHPPMTRRLQALGVLTAVEVV